MNQCPEQKARHQIDKLPAQSRLVVQDKTRSNLTAGVGMAIGEYPTDIGPADYIVFVDKMPVGVFEAKGEEDGVRLPVVEDKSKDYASHN